MTPSSAPPRGGFYFIKGTMRPNEPSYVERQADSELLSGLLRGEFCYVLTSRQMGKSSLMVRTAQRLRAEGLDVEVLDLAVIGQNVTVEQWYAGILFQLGLRHRMEARLLEFWRQRTDLGPMQRWLTAIRTVLLPALPGRLVVLIDEIDSVRSLPFRTDEFFAGIRECYNLRSEDAALERLTFGLFGVVTPAELIQDARTTPFNIGHRIDLRDFSAAEARTLIPGLGRGAEQGEQLLDRVLHWSNGHPFLTQRICQVIAQDDRVREPQDVDLACDALFFSQKWRWQDENLQFVQERILRETDLLPSLLDVYGRIRKGRHVRIEPASPVNTILQLSGIVRTDDGRPRVRNRIYERVFDLAWVRANMPDAETRRQRAAARRAAIRIALLSAAIIGVIGWLAIKAERESESRRQTLYLRQVGLAWQEWNDNANSERAEELLQDILPKGRDTDLRSLEWDWLKGLTTREARSLQVRNDIYKVSFSEDGEGLVVVELSPAVGTRASEHFVKMYDRSLTRSSDVFSIPAAANFHPVAFSPDRRLVAVEDARRNVVCWDVARRQEVARIPWMGNPISAVAFSLDGRWIAIADEKGQVKWRDGRTSEDSPVFPGPGREVRQLAFSPDGEALYAVDGSRTLRGWRVRDRLPVKGLQVAESSLVGVTAHPDGRRLLISGEDGGLRFYDLLSRQWQPPFASQEGGTRVLSFAPNGALFATGSFDRTVRLWASDRIQEVAVIKGHGAEVSDVAWSADSRQLATVGANGILKVWDVTRQTQLAWRKKVFQASLEAGGFTRSGEPIVFGVTEDGFARIWNTTTLETVATLRDRNGEMRFLPRQILFASFSANGEWLATGGDDHTIRLWEVSSGRLVNDSWKHDNYVYNLDFAPDGATLMSGGADHRIRLWSLAERRLLAELGTTGDNSYRGRFSPDGRILATAATDGGVNLWEAASRRWVRKLIGHGRKVRALAFTQDSAVLATGGEDNSILLWDVASGRLLRKFGNTTNPQRLIFSPDGRRLISGSVDGTVKLWDVASGQEIFTINGHQSQITAVQIGPDKKSLLVASQSGVVTFFRGASP